MRRPAELLPLFTATGRRNVGSTGERKRRIERPKRIPQWMEERVKQGRWSETGRMERSNYKNIKNNVIMAWGY